MSKRRYFAIARMTGHPAPSRGVLLLLAIVLTLTDHSPSWAGDPPSMAPDEQLEAQVKAFESGLRPPVEVRGEPPVRWTLAERMEYWKTPGFSIAVIKDGRVVWAKGYGTTLAGGGEPVDASTVFSVGSLSKVASAALALRLVQDGRLALDEDVNRRLVRWKVPQAEGFSEPVTLRRLLSHTAGLTVSGFADYGPEEALPSVIDTLDGRPPAKNEPVRIFYEPGTRSAYSGGGTTVAQLMMEDVTGVAFPELAQSQLFGPLGMTRSSFENPLPAEHGNIAKAHDEDGRPDALPRGWHTFPEMAASGLWTTPTDYAAMIIALIDAYQGKVDGPFRPSVIRQMMTEVGPGTFGIGPDLEGLGTYRRFTHSGSNESYQAWMEGHLELGSGLVMVTNGVAGDALYAEARRSAAEAFALSFGSAVISSIASFEPADAVRWAGTYSFPATSRALDEVRYWGSEPFEIRLKHIGDGELHLAFAYEASEADSELTWKRLAPVSPNQGIWEGSPWSVTPIEIEFVQHQPGANVLIIASSGDRYALTAAKDK